MAITITANDANGDGSGINVWSYLASFDVTFTRDGFGWFSSDPTDYSGSEFATTEQPNLLLDTTKQSVVMDAGGSGASLDYDILTHVVGGDLDAVSFGYGLTYTSSFQLSQLDLRISGLGFVDQTGAGNAVHALMWDLMGGNITNLTDLLASNEINFIGSTGADVFTGYSHDDTIAGNGGNDTIDGGDGDDTAVFYGNRADYSITDNGDGTFTVTDNRTEGEADGADTLTGVEFAQFADETVALGAAENQAPVINVASDGVAFALSESVAAAPRGVVSVRVADVDNDGDLDLIAGTYLGEAGVYVLENDGAGNFELGAKIADNNVWRPLVADLDGDGNVDYASINYGTSSTVWYKGNGDGTFGAAQQLATGAQQTIAAADLDGDGDLDVVTIAANAINLQKNNGDGTFSEVAIASGVSGVYSVAVSDLNGDGSLDFVATTSSGGFMAYLGDGAGGFTASDSESVKTVLGLSYGYLENVKVADIDDDGNLDAIATSANDQGIYLLRGNGDGTFGAAEVLASGSSGAQPGTVDLEIVDVNGDGKLDILAPSMGKTPTGGGTLSWYEHKSDGSFEEHVIESAVHTTASEFVDIAAGDFNGDGTIDLLSSGQVYDSNAGSSTYVRIASGSPSIVVDENVATAITAVTFSDDQEGPVVVTFSVDRGTLSAVAGDGVAVEGAGSQVTLTGTVTDINGFIAAGNLTFLTDLHDEIAAVLNVSIDDQESADPATTTTQLLLAVEPMFDEAPTDLTIDNAAIAENSAIGTVIGTLSATDPEGGPVTFSIASDPWGAVSLDGNTLVLDRAVDYEAQASYDIVVRATDVGGEITEKSITIAVTNVNEAPTAVALSNAKVIENSPAGTVVGTLSTTDPDSGDTFIYAIANDTGAFEIVGGQLVVQDLGDAFNHSVTVVATDSGGLTTEKTFKIVTTDADGNPLGSAGTIVIDASTATAGIDFEAFIRGGFISDAVGGGFPVFDNGAAFTGEEMFIGYGTDPTSKYVFAHGELEYYFGTHTVAGTINSIEYGTRGEGTYDANGYFTGGSAELTITGLNLNNPIPANSAEEAEIEANGPVHNFAVSYMYGASADQARLDKYADSLDDYAQHFIGSALNDVFTGSAFNDVIEGGGGNDTLNGGGGNDEISDGSGRNTINGGEGDDTYVINGNRADYDVYILSSATYINVKGESDYDTLKTMEYVRFNDVLINLVTKEETPVGDNLPPTDLSLSASEVAENSATGTVIGTLSATDADDDVLTYTLTDDADGKFALVTDAGVTKLVVNGALDFEIATSHEVTVKVSDGNGGETARTFTVEVTDADEGPAPIVITNGNFTLTFDDLIWGENIQAGTVLGTVTLANPGGLNYIEFYGYNFQSWDLTDKIDFVSDSITWVSGTDLNGETTLTMQMVAKVALDFTSLDALNLYFSAFAADWEEEATLDFDIAINEAPENVGLSQNDVAEDAAVGTVIGVLSATDAEGDVLSYTLEDDAGGKFTLVTEEGVTSLVVNSALDYETATSHGVTIKVSDGESEVSQAFTVNVTNVEEVNLPPTDITLSNTNVSEGQRVGSVVGVLSAIDPEGDAISWSLVPGQGDNDDFFTLRTNDDGSVSVVLKLPLDFEGAAGTDGVYDLVVRATDSQGNETTQAIAVQSTDESVMLTAAPTGKNYAGVMENVAVGQEIGFFVDFDDRSTALVVTLLDDADGLFTITTREVGGVTRYYLTVNGPLDYETASLHSVTIRATGVNGVTQDKTYEIHVLDAAEEGDTARGTITIDASTTLAEQNGGVNWDTYLDAQYAKVVTALPAGVAFAPNTSSEYVYELSDGSFVALQGSNLAYWWTDPESGEDVHVVGGTVTGLTFGEGTNYVLTSPELTISGLDLSNGSDPLDRIYGEANIATVTWMYGPDANHPADIEFLKAQIASYAQNFIGSAGNDIYTGTLFADTVTGNGGTDLLAGGGGDDTIDGGEGEDTAIFTGNKADYTIVDNGDGTWTVTDNRTVGVNDGTDTLNGVEFAQFADETVGLSDNAAPVAGDDNVSGAKNIKTTIDVLANDQDFDGTLDGATITIVDEADHGTVTVKNGQIVYTPTKDYVGTDSFTYTVKDDDGTVSNEATVSVDLAGKLTLTSADEAFVADLLGIGPVEVDGGAGDDYLGGSSNPSTAGADIFYGGEGNDVIFGATGDDHLEGNAGDDILRSGSGNDTLIGGEGNDTYGIRIFANKSSGTTDKGTVTIVDDDGVLWNGTIRPDPMPEGWPAGQQPPATAGYQIAGMATYVSPGVWDLAVVDDSGVTKHFALGWTGGDLTITAGNEVVTVKDYVNGTFGITLENAYTLTDGDDVFSNAALGIAVFGLDGVDHITTGVGDDYLDGGLGVDVLTGGAGNDTYAVDSSFEEVVENADEGIDTVLASASYALRPNIENITLLGTGDLAAYGNDLVNIMRGNSGNNFLDGGAGADTMIGGDGTDIYVVDSSFDQVIENTSEGTDVVYASASYQLGNNVEYLYLTGVGNISGYGNALNNYLQGNSGNNVLDGGAGSDTMIGGAGIDVYFVDSSFDVVVENANEGTDVVYSSVAYQLGNELEYLYLTGTDNINGFGNSVNNYIEGNSGNNGINGGAGSDTMVGWGGDDLYFVDSSFDVIIENANEGTDVVYSSVAYQLGNNLEYLYLTGTSNINGFGNSVTNYIQGNSGDNGIDGGGGTDALVGGGGSDTFIFRPGQANGDIVYDFDGAGSGAGDFLQFTGYGAEATFTNIDATHWQINYNGDTQHDIITFANAATIHASDFYFV